VAIFNFRADIRTREVPKFGLEQLNRLEDILNVRFDTCSLESGDRLPVSDQRIQQFHSCRKAQCFLGFQTQGDSVQVNLGMLSASSSVYINIKPDLISSEKMVESVKKEILTYFSAPSSVSISDVNQEYLSIARDRSIPSPSAYFASGMDWYLYLSPEIWQSHYAQDVITAAPGKVHILEDGYLEWHAYDSLRHFDSKAVIKNRTYFGEKKEEVDRGA